MKKIILILLAIAFMPAMAQATPIWDDGELLPVPKGGYSITTTGPTEAPLGPDVMIYLNGEKWQNTTEGPGLLHWNANIFYSYFDNAKTEFYYFMKGHEHEGEYPEKPGAVPIPPSVWMFGTGLAALGLFRGRVKNG